MSKALFLQQTVGGSLSRPFWLAELHRDSLGKWGWLALPLPTAANKWQLADQAGQAVVTPGRATNKLSGCSGTTRQPACLWLEQQWEGPRAPVRAAELCLWEAQANLLFHSQEAPIWAASFLSFPTSGRGRAVGVVWEGWLGRLCSQR